MQIQNDVRESAKGVCRAQSEYNTAKHMYFLYCDEDSSIEKKSSRAWQEMHRQSIHRFKQARAEFIEKRQAHVTLCSKFEEMVKSYQRMKKIFKESIQKSR